MRRVLEGICMSRERALVISRVRIEKYDIDMNLVDIHESKVPTITSKEINNGIKEKDKKKDKK
jgi:hypothetical protein